MKLIHTGDIHLDPRRPEPALASLRRLAEYCQEHQPLALLLAGDLFDRALPATTAAGMTDLLEEMKEISFDTTIIALTGTPTHDRPGAYAPLLDCCRVLTEDRPSTIVDGVLLVTGTQEPRMRVVENGRLNYADTEMLVLEETRTKLRKAAQMAAEMAAGQVKVHVHMHHGAIAAATTDTGYYTTGAPGELSLLPQDLDLPQARYVALGHIHQQQRVDGCITEAWYCGSAYPVDWGERDQKGALLVTIPKNAGASVRPLPYPHRPRRKFTITVPAGNDVVDALNSAPELQPASHTGCEVWLQVTHDPSLNFTAAEETVISAMIRRSTGLDEGHRLDLRPASREAVVRADLSEQPSWADQLKTWLSVTDGPTASPAQLKLAADLQAQTAGPTGGQRRAWRIDGLLLHGARGLAGGNLDLDLSAYPPGLLAIAGPNGAGKTTVLEHMCPWPELLTRGGSLSAAFVGSDARRRLTFYDTETRIRYHLEITIAGSGQRHHAIDNLLPDGTTRTYVEEVEKLFGDRSTYVAGGIQPQKPITLRLRGPDGSSSNCTSDLIAAPAGMRRHLLRAILGLDAYQHGSVLAREAAKAKDKALSDVQARRDLLPDADTEAAGMFQTAESEWQGAVEVLELATKRRDELQEEQEAVTAAADNTRNHQREIDTYRGASDMAAGYAEAAQKAADKHLADAERLPLLQAHVERGEGIRVVVDAAAVDAERARLARDREMEPVNQTRNMLEDAARREHAKLLAGWQQKVDESLAVGTEQARLEAIIERHRADQETALSAVQRFSEPAVRCPTCGQPMGADNRLTLHAAALTDSEQHEQAAAQAEQDLAKLENETKPGTAPAYLPPDLSAIDAKLLDLDKPTPADELLDLHKREYRNHVKEWLRLTDGDNTALQKAQAAAADAATRLAESKREAERSLEASARADEIEATIDRGTLIRETEHRTAIAVADTKVRDLTTVHAHAGADLRLALDRLEREVKRLERSKVLDESAAKYLAEMTDAHLLADALSPTGIQALLLEGAAPQIAADANAMLADSYGERWQIRLELQKIGRDKIAEDLRIVVSDTESVQQPSDDQLGPGEQLAETLSGGEATWIRQALAGALALARARHTGLRQLTALLDEADGALSEDARAKYFDLLETQHRMLGRHHTIVVTHSQEMLDRLGPERVIRLGE